MRKAFASDTPNLGRMKVYMKLLEQGVSGIGAPIR